MDLNSNSNNRSRTHSTHHTERKPLGGEAFKYLGSWTNQLGTWIQTVAALQSDERLYYRAQRQDLCQQEQPSAPNWRVYNTMVLAIGLYKLRYLEQT
jgi:hypothetical protein